MLSNVNLESALGKHIGIYPINLDRLEGASIDLTASRYAWSINTKKSVVMNNSITIAPGDTVIVFSNEFISLDNKYAGACYNRISFSMKGIIHASSPLKPNYTGRFSVTLCNASDVDVVLAVGDPIVVIMFHKLDKEATITQGNGNGSRFDLLQAMNITVEDEKTRTEITSFDDREKLIRTMKSSNEYKEIKRRDLKRKFRFFSPLIICIAVVLAYLFLGPLRGKSVDLLTASMGSLIGGTIAGLIVLFIQIKLFQKI